MIEENDLLNKLLKFKKSEQPNEDFWNDLEHSIQERVISNLIVKKSKWKIFIESLSPRKLAFAFASCCALTLSLPIQNLTWQIKNSSRFVLLSNLNVEKSSLLKNSVVAKLPQDTVYSAGYVVKAPNLAISSKQSNNYFCY